MSSTSPDLQFSLRYLRSLVFSSTVDTEFECKEEGSFSEFKDMGFLEFRNEDEGLTLKAVLEVAGEEDGIERKAFKTTEAS